MNWTGGRLSRHARKTGGSIINKQKQKQHFARVRNTLLHGANKSPKKFSLFDSITINVKRGSPERGDNEPLRPRQSSPSRHRHPQHYHSGRKRHHEAAGPERDERSKRRRISPHAQDGIHDAAKIKKEAFKVSLHKIKKADITEIDDEMEVLRRKKLKLLRDSDWLGLNLQEPVKLKYASTGVDDNIGKRRRLKPGHEARYEKQYMHSSPVRHGYDALSQVRVAIDGKARRVGVSSSVAPQSHGRAQPPLSSQSSEPMLLEGRPASVISYDFRGRCESRQQTCHRSDSHRSNHRVQNAYTEAPHEHEKGVPQPWEDLGQFATAATKQRMFYETAPSFSSSTIRKRAKELGCAPYDDESCGKFTNLFPLPSSEHHSSQKLPVIQRRIRPASQSNSDDAHKKGRLIMPSSPPVLHHPVPHRATSKVLRTNSIEIASSVAATVGEVPKWTETAKEEDEMWKSWLDEDAVDRSDAGPGPDEADDQRDRQRSITPGVSQYVPRQSSVKDFEKSSTLSVSGYVPSSSAAEISENIQGSRSSGPTVESIASGPASNASLGHNAMRISSFADSITISASRTPSAHTQAPLCVGQAADAIASSALVRSSRAESRPRISLPLPNIRVTEKVDDDRAWKVFLQSPSELRFDAEPLRPFQNPPVRRQTKQGKVKTKTPDPDATWKSFVLTNDSDSEGENPAFNSFWKKNEWQAAPTQRLTSSGMQTSSSHASLEVHVPTSMELPELPFPGACATTPTKLKSYESFLSSNTSDYLNNPRLLDGRSMDTIQSQISFIADSESQILDDKSIYADHSNASMNKRFEPSASGQFKLRKGAGQTMKEGLSIPAFKPHAKAPLGERGLETFKRTMPFSTLQKSRKESFVGDLDNNYVQEANKEMRKEMWRKVPNGEERVDRGIKKGKGRERQTKSIWDIPSSDSDYVEDS